MKALLLAAGKGTRLKPLTDKIPKCLLPINNKPLLFHWLEILEKENISEVIINTHHLSEKTIKAINKRNNKIKITITFEKNLLGSAGTIFYNKDILSIDDDFLIIYADNYTNVKLKPLIDFHKKNNALYTTYVYQTDTPNLKGIFEYDECTGQATSFEEKPSSPKSDIANAGIGVLSKNIFNYEVRKTPCDFGKEILPQIVDKTYLIKTNEIIIDIGTYKDYCKIQDILSKENKD
jgi:mannose-1-phosphate guanylyltransferase